MFSVVVPADAQQRMPSAESGRAFSRWAWCVAKRDVNNLASVLGFLLLVCFKIFAKICGHGRSTGQTVVRNVHLQDGQSCEYWMLRDNLLCKYP